MDIERKIQLVLQIPGNGLLRNIGFIFGLAVIIGSLHAQPARTSAYSREISMDVDNDIFYFIDYYYTAGQDLNYRQLVRPKSRLFRILRAGNSDSAKVVVAYTAGFKIFTPRDIDHADTKTMDRPYAGWSYARFGITNFPTSRSINRYEVESGVVGKTSGMQQLQKWVHEKLDFEVPKGWGSQIRDEVVVNLYYTRYQEFPLYNSLDVVSQSAVQGGTGGNKISQDFTFRTLHFNKLSNSAFTQSRLSWDRREQALLHKNEFFLFLGAGLDYVMSNIFIQGSLFKDNKSSFTVPMQPVVLRETFGMMFASRSITWNITTVHLSKEVKAGIGHEYVSLGMAVRF